jgi:7,8-dihydropterin-6-yl-methyl-4-(beta-D-ribofuranosyl)aminobenzene 5'-phosphate synthase
MIIKTLVENTSISDDFKSERGLSLYIKTHKHKMLFDLGLGSLFVENAEKMNVDLKEVDLVIISHGHYDHGGGLRKFLEINKKAKIYLNINAFKGHYSYRKNIGMKYAGLDTSLLPNDRFIFVSEDMIIDEELELITNIKGDKLFPSINKTLYMDSPSGEKVHDTFSHEQNLILKQDNKVILISGCSHRGVVNIIEHVESLNNYNLTHVIGGFHLYSGSSAIDENPMLVHKLGEYLKNTDKKYFTCHCTGINSYKILKDIMGEQIDYLKTGSQLVL